MTLHEFLQRLNDGETIDFSDTMAVIDEHYEYQPTAFSNGLDDDMLDNPAGNNEGSCKIFAFALINQLDQAQTLQLFGDYYRKDVLDNPDGDGHQNIRRFIKYGWDGIRFDRNPLTEK